MSLSKNKTNLNFYWKILKDSFSKFSDDDIFTHAAALSYYTIFSLPPMILIVIFTTSLFYSEATVEAVLFNQIGDLVGQDGAQQLLLTIKKLRIFEPRIWATLLGVGILIFTSTTVFITMQNTLNKIFGVKAKPMGQAVFQFFRDRILSFALLIGVAFILLVSLAVNAFLVEFGKYLEQQFELGSQILSISTIVVLPFIINTVLFAMIFKFLPDAKLRWKDTWFGAVLTSFLFAIGKYLISFYIGTSNVSGLYDAAGSIMVIMVWVFYASLIVMYGAVFTYTHIKAQGDKIKASDYAVKVEYQEIEKPKVK